MFQPNSRYSGIEIAEHVEHDGRVVRYVRRRFVSLQAAQPLAEHSVVAGDRLDNISARYLGDPEQFWRVCDANHCERPADLTARPTRVLIIPMPSLR